ncbi:ATP-binding protein [Roseivirga sp. BDSF3-8]|uniref:GAF domain-containing sensor histidine kinase n=1 Tax=Roseivirga sp. BDSF3-8 TaxID=3241598 RepID=UPI003532593E
MEHSDPEIQKDIEHILQIPSMPLMLNVICKSTGMRFAAIARVTDEKWVTCISQDEINFGLKPGDELELQTTICNEIRQHHNPVVIDKVSKDATYCTHKTPIKYGFESYISFPIYLANGEFFGTLCAIDPEPASLKNKETADLFKLYTELISFYLDSAERLRKTKENLIEEKEIARLRETFIAILGHDLRNPLSATKLSVDLLDRLDLPEEALKPIKTIKTSSSRMQELIDNLLDFARAELGEGISLELANNPRGLDEELKGIIKEYQAVNQSHVIKPNISISKPFACDIRRIGQLFSNLLGNAIKHGAANEPIDVTVIVGTDSFSIAVVNTSNHISKSKLENIFKPFKGNSTENNSNGLGLGLYIASEIAKAHKGKIDAWSENGKTGFEFTMPI